MEFQDRRNALVGVSQWLEHRACAPEGLGFDSHTFPLPSSGECWKQRIDVSLSSLFSLSPPPPPLPSTLSKIQWEKYPYSLSKDLKKNGPFTSFSSGVLY